MAVRPVPDRVTQRFGVKSPAYRLGYHPGTDYGSKTGRNIVATADGQVLWLPGSNGGYGNVIALILKNGDVVWHAHTLKIIRKGRVKKGQIIGQTDNTGWTTGPHVHIELRKGGNQNRPIDFDAWLKANPESKPPQPIVLRVRSGEGLSHLAKRTGYKDWARSSRWQAITNLNKKGWSWQKFNVSLKINQKVRTK